MAKLTSLRISKTFLCALGAAIALAPFSLMGNLKSDVPKLVSSVQTKKVLIFSSKGGYCSEAAARAIQKALGPGYTFAIERPIDDLSFFGIPLVDTFFNAPQRSGWNRTLNILTHIAPMAYKIGEKQIQKVIDAYLDKQEPDLVISVCPFMNSCGIESAKKHNIPYMLIALDDDLTFWTNGLKGVNYPKFCMTIPRDEPITKQGLKKHRINPRSVFVAGQPIRPEFLTPKDPEHLRKKYRVPKGKKVVLIMMGGTGSSASTIYAREIGKLDANVHLIVCIGRDEARRKELELVPLHYSNSIEVIGFTDKIADLMAIADLVVTKPGPGTIHEAITTGRAPILIDRTVPPVFWEKAHLDYVLKYGIGGQVTRVKHLPKILQHYLHDQSVRVRIQKTMKELPHEDFQVKVKEIVEELLS